MEAVTHLRRATGNSAEACGEACEHMGSSLLSFSMASLSFNLLLLLMYWRCVGSGVNVQETRTLPPPPQLPSELPLVATASELPLEPLPDNAVNNAGRSGRRSGQRSAKFCSGFSEPSGTAHAGAQGARACCRTPTGRWAALHALVHPGCGPAPTPVGSGPQGDDLNTRAAALHVVADVLRSFTVFALALLIKLNVVSRPDLADACAAIMIAAIILAGASAMLLRVCRLLCSTNVVLTT